MGQIHGHIKVVDVKLRPQIVDAVDRRGEFMLTRQCMVSVDFDRRRQLCVDTA
jgi:hypothetical protein